MTNNKPFWETGIHPITGKCERTKILTKEQKQRNKAVRIERKSKTL